jgi:streptogramin lyase
MKTRAKLALACSFAALLSACGGGGSHGGGPLPLTSPSPSQSSPPTSSQTANVQFAIAIPAIAAPSVASGRARRMDFTASTQSVTIAIGTQVLKTADVSATSSLCAAASGGGRTCTVGVNAPSGNDVFTITAYDQPNGTGNAIAKGTVHQSTSAQPAAVKVAVSGTITKLALSLSNPSPLAGASASANVLVTGLDADGNTVLGAFTSPISLKDSDTSGVTKLSATTVTDSSTPVTFDYTGATPFISATITASLSGLSPVTTTFAPTPNFAHDYPVLTAPSFFGPSGPGIWNITKGPDGNMWAVATGLAQVFKVALDGSYTLYSLTTPSAGLRGITVGADGNLWFGESNSGAIGTINTSSGSITEYPLPGTASPCCVALGPDHNVWFFDNFSREIGKITTSGTVTEYPMPTNTVVGAITAGPDGNLWMADGGTNAILKVSTSGSVLAAYTVPTKNAIPIALTFGPDGNVWIVERQYGKIARMTPSGTFTEWDLPSGHSTLPSAIAAGPDGRIWYAEQGTVTGGGKVGYITVDGKDMREFTGLGFHVHDFAFDANGTLWTLELSDYHNGAANDFGKFVY